jgi:hypothetical protein
VVAAVVATVTALVFSAVASATETAAENFSGQTAEESGNIIGGALKVFALGVLGLVVLITVVTFVWKLIRKVVAGPFGEAAERRGDARRSRERS